MKLKLMEKKEPKMSLNKLMKLNYKEKKELKMLKKLLGFQRATVDFNVVCFLGVAHQFPFQCQEYRPWLHAYPAQLVDRFGCDGVV